MDILSATGPIFLVVGLGYMVTRLGVLRRQDMSVLSTYVVKVGKLVLMPLVAWAALAALTALGLPPLGPALASALVITAATPTMSMVPAVAEQHGEGDFGAATMLLSTLVSFVTLSAWLFALHSLGWL